MLSCTWRRERGKRYSIKLNTMPIRTHWNGVLKLLPPSDEGGGMIHLDRHFKGRRARPFRYSSYVVQDCGKDCSRISAVSRALGVAGIGIVR